MPFVIKDSLKEISKRLTSLDVSRISERRFRMQRETEALRQQVGNSAGQPKGIEAAAYELELEEAVRGL